MDTEAVVLGVLQLAFGIGWTVLVLADRPRPPDHRRHFKGSASMTFPTVLALFWVALGMFWLGRGLLG